VEGKSVGQLFAELRAVFGEYPEYGEPDRGGGSFAAMVGKFSGDDFFNLHFVAKRFSELLVPELESRFRRHYGSEFLEASDVRRASWTAGCMDSLAPSIGSRVAVAGSGGEWVVAERIVDGAEDVSFVRAVVRSIVSDNPTLMAGYYGTTALAQRDRYTWLSVEAQRLGRCDNTGIAPGVVRRLTCSADSHGPYKKAIVSGERFPETAFHDPSWVEFLETLRQRGYVIPPSVSVECGVSAAHLDHGIYTLGQVLAAEVASAAEREQPVSGQGGPHAG
jgi:hypothetical protein